MLYHDSGGALPGFIRPLLALSLLLVPSFARGQDKPPPSAQSPVLVPPRILGTPEVAYPEGGQGDAEVILVLTVQKGGHVSHVEVAQGKEPFGSAAQRAATSFQFEPGRRNGVNVAVRIRFAVTFRQTKVKQPPSEEPITAAATTDAPPDEPAVKKPIPSKPEPITVDIRGEKPPPSVFTLSRAEVRQIPGTLGDPFRALETLPGVVPVVSGLPYFYVRGAPPGNVGYYLDGVRVPYLFHVGVGPSVVNPAMVERVHLYSGGYPAELGRFAGAIVTADTTSPRVDFHGEATLRLFDAGGMVETGFAGGRGTVMLGGRYSYTAALLSLFSPTAGLDYRDYQARVTYDLSPRDRIGLVAFGAYDLLTDKTYGVEKIAFGAEFYRFDLRYERSLSSGGILKMGTTFGYDQSRLGVQRNAQDRLFATRLSLVQPLHPKLTLRAGLDVQFDHYTADERRWSDPRDPNTVTYDNLFPPRDDTALAAYAEYDWQMDRRVKLTTGLRFDAFRSGSATATSFSPRLSMVAQVHPRIRILHAIGLASQPPGFVLPLPGMAIGNLRNGLQKSVQASAGVEVELPWGMTTTVTAFENVFENMSDMLNVFYPKDALQADWRTQGYGRGLEVYLRRRFTAKLGGFVSYTLSESVRTSYRSTHPSTFDRRHVLNAALGYEFPRKIRAGARVTFYTGAPNADFPIWGVLDPSDPQNTRRDPSFFRLDLRLEKRFELRNQRWLSITAEMINSTLTKEIIRGAKIGPISIPSLGLEGAF